MSKLTRREILLAKIETTYNTDPTPDGSNAILVENLAWSHEGARMVERPAIRRSLAPLQQIFAGTLRQMTFDVEIKGSGTADTPPELGPLLRACGMAEDIVTGTSVTYQPASENQESITFYYFEDGTRYKVTGARGNVTSDLSTGGVGKLSFTFTGHVDDGTDTTAPAPTFVDTVPPPLINVPFTVGSFLAVTQQLQFDLSNTVATPPSISAGDGYGEIIVTNRDVSGSFDPEAELKANQDFIQDWKDGVTKAIDTGVIGNSAGNQYQITFPKAHYREVSPGDRDSIRTYDMSFGAAESTTDDEVSIVFT